LLEFLFSSARELQFAVGSLLGLLDKTVKDDKVILRGAKQHSRDAIAREIGANLPQTIAHGPA
jgi:hypothetical protein